MLVFQYHDLYLVTVKKNPGNSNQNKKKIQRKKKATSKKMEAGENDGPIHIQIEQRWLCQHCLNSSVACSI